MLALSDLKKRGNTTATGIHTKISFLISLIKICIVSHYSIRSESLVQAGAILGPVLRTSAYLQLSVSEECSGSKIG